jgi:hypothetical protein
MTHTLTATQELGGFPKGKQEVVAVLGETIFDTGPTVRNLERISQLEGWKGWMLWPSWTGDTYCSGMVALFGSHIDLTFIKEGQPGIWKSGDGHLTRETPCIEIVRIGRAMVMDRLDP